MKKYLAIFAIALLGGFLGTKVTTVHAQTPTPIVVTVTGSHTLCPVSSAGTMVLCGAGDGLWLSIGGTPLAQVATVSQTAVGGVLSISVNGGTPQTGAVVLTIPTKVTLTATAPTITGTIQ